MIKKIMRPMKNFTLFKFKPVNNYDAEDEH